MAEKRSSKTLNSSRNIVFGFALKLYQLLMPFIIRTIIIYVLGMEYAGLNSLFTSILSVLNIAELGVGTIMVFYMYKPIEEKETAKICALMCLYKIYYRIIGTIVLAIGLALVPFLPNLVKGNIPAGINLYTLYYLNLGATVFSYWLFAYKNSLFQAHQRNDVVSKVTLLTDTIKYILQISLLYIFKDYYYYVIVLLLVQILNNILIAKRANKAYPEYKPQGSLTKSERQQINTSIKDVFYGQLGMTITLSIDSIIISAFLGLVPLAQYQNYYYIVNALIAFFTIFYQSLRASIGTNILVKSSQNNYIDFKFITFLVMAALSFCSASLLTMFQPFIKLWVGGKNLLNYGCVILLVIYFLVYEFSVMIGCYKDISGKWHADRFRALITAVVNLGTNIIMVQYIGLYGVLLSTILSFAFINIPWLYHRVFIDVFNKEQKQDYTKYLVKMIGVLLIISVVSYVLCNRITVSSTVAQLCINFLICILSTIVIFYTFNKNDIGVSRIFGLAKRVVKRVV